MKTVVQLRCASLPWPVGLVADHCWFVVFDDTGACHRWEVWQKPDAGGRSFGHVHCDLKNPDAGVGGGPPRVLGEWRGAEAARLRAVLERPADYPHCRRYRYWPGPNSNTFAAWVLARAGVAAAPGWRAVGWRWLRRARPRETPGRPRRPIFREQERMQKTPSEPFIERATADLRSRVGGAIQCLWDEPAPATPDVRRLTVIARDLPIVFPVEHDVLVKRGAPYEKFLDTVAAEVARVLSGERPAPPTA